MCCIYICILYKSILVKQPQTRKQVTLVSDGVFAGLGDAGDQKLGDQEFGRGMEMNRNWSSKNFVAEICLQYIKSHMGISKNIGTPKSSILIGFSIIFTIHFGVPLFLETPIYYT